MKYVTLLFVQTLSKEEKLQVAIKQQDVTEVENLIRDGADVTWKNSRHFNSMQCAAVVGNVEIGKMILTACGEDQEKITSVINTQAFKGKQNRIRQEEGINDFCSV